MPFLLSADGKSLIAHVAKHNPQWECIETQEVLITFQGPHDYVSPSWYSSTGVPTWNYQSVHLYGKCVPITDAKKKENIVNNLTNAYESQLEKPWEPKYKESMLDAIVGLEIKIKEIQCKFKLSQNRSKQDRQQVIEQLKKRGNGLLSKEIKIVL